MRSERTNVAAEAAAVRSPGVQVAQQGDAGSSQQMQAQMPESGTPRRPAVSFRDWAAI